MNKLDKKHCQGCEDDFYNGKNQYGVKECCRRNSAKIIKRKKVGLNAIPPWTWKPEKYPSCYRQKGSVFIDCEKEDRQF